MYYGIETERMMCELVLVGFFGGMVAACVADSLVKLWRVLKRRRCNA